MNYLDAIVACPNGFSAILTEYHAKGYGEFLHYENGVPVMLSSRLNRFYPEVVNFNTPCLAYLRGAKEDMERLASVAWDNATIFIMISPNGIYEDIQEDPVKFAQYRSYYDWEPDDPRYGTIRPIGIWA